MTIGVTTGIDALREQLREVLIGQEQAIELVLVCLLAGGHVLLEGAPGVGKTLLARSVAQGSQLGFRRVQVTPDLMPADVTGMTIWNPQEASFTFKKGPVFTDLLLADELNRAPARTQAALLEAMQEKQVTIDGVSHPLSELFTVIATQNPLEFEGTYGLPEAQLDRFLLRIKVGYPSPAASKTMLERSLHRTGDEPVQAQLTPEELLSLREKVRAVRVESVIVEYVNRVIHATRELRHVRIGASPRSAVMLLQAARARAYLEGREYVMPEDVQHLLEPVLGHRLHLSAEAQIGGVSAEATIEELRQSVGIPR